MNYKFLPIGGTDLWSHYPVISAFANDSPPLLAGPEVAQTPLAEDQQQPQAIREDRLIGSPRAAPSAADWMIGSPRPAPDPALPNPAAVDDSAQLAAHDRYEAAVAAVDERSYAIPFTDTTMAPPTH